MVLHGKTIIDIPGGVNFFIYKYMEEIKYTIYKLIDPITNEVRYVGLTFNTLKQRLKSHCSEKSKSHKSNWVSGVMPLGKQIGIFSFRNFCQLFVSITVSIGDTIIGNQFVSPILR